MSVDTNSRGIDFELCREKLESEDSKIVKNSVAVISEAFRENIYSQGWGLFDLDDLYEPDLGVERQEFEQALDLMAEEKGFPVNKASKGYVPDYEFGAQGWKEVRDFYSENLN